MSNQPASSSSGVSPEPRRWTIAVCPVGHLYVGKDDDDVPEACMGPGMLAGWCHCRLEQVEVMSVEEHDRAMAEARVDVENHRRNEEVALDALQESSSRNARLLSALESIRDRDWVENALDPQWGAGIARAALDASTTRTGRRRPSRRSARIAAAAAAQAGSLSSAYRPVPGAQSLGHQVSSLGAPKPVGELANGDLVWPGPTYLIRIHGDPERMVDQDICNVIEGHYNVLARIERDGHA